MENEQRVEFLKLLNLIEGRMDKLSDFRSRKVIGFTLDECETDFMHGEEGLACELLIENLCEVRFPITNEIYESISMFGKSLGLMPKWLNRKWPILQNLITN